MTTNKHDFEELAAPKVAAKELGISVATLRKYSLIVEKVTGNSNYFARTKQKARLYHQKDIDDLKAFHHLSKNSGLTLQERPAGMTGEREAYMHTTRIVP